MQTMYRLIITIALLALLAGCASQEVQKAQADASAAQQQTHQALIAAFNTLGAGGDAARVAAIMALAQQASPMIRQAMPSGQADQILQWARLLLGTAADVYRIRAGRDVAIEQSHATRDVSLASYQAIEGTAGVLAAQIQAPGPVTTTTTETTNSIGGAGVIGAGSYATADRHDTTTMTDRHDLTTTDSHDQTAPPHVVNPLVITTGP